MEYAYIRVSSTTQNIGRQFEELKKLGIDEKNMFIDKESGKDFNRKYYKKLIKKIKENDVIYIKSIDRLGRNYDEIGNQWKLITKIKKADIVVIDMPLLDTRNRPDNLIGKFISDIILQLLSFIAENERNNIKERQAEGIKLAHERGIKFGRPPFKITEEFANDVIKFNKKELDLRSILAKHKISKTSFYKYKSLALL